MTIAVKLFGPQAELVGRREVVLEIQDDPVTCGELRRVLSTRCSTLGTSLGSSRLAVNQAFAAESDLIRAGDEVALIGLISGG